MRAYCSKLMYRFWQMPADRELLSEPSSPNSDRDAAHFILKTLLQQPHGPFAAGGYRRPTVSFCIFITNAHSRQLLVSHDRGRSGAAQ